MLIDTKVLADVIDAAKIRENEIVCEAGTGRGILTAELCRHALKVISYEVDKVLYAEARKRLRYPNLELINSDLFKTESLQFDTLVSNLPYSRSRDALEWLAGQNFGRAVVMVQREFADKLSAAPGERNYRAISVLAKHCFRIEELFSVSRKSFEPQPFVESVVLRLVPVNTLDREMVKALNLLFSRRNKKASSVAAKAGVEDIDSGDKRIDQLSPDRIVQLAGLMPGK